MPHDDNNPVPVLADFLSNVPPPLTIVLLQLAPCIYVSRNAIQIASWAANWYHSWLSLAGWWALCLFIDSTLRRFLPFVVLAFFAFVHHQQRNQTFQAPTTEQSLRNVITDLTIIQSLLPSIFSAPSVALSKLLRVCVILYVPYLILTVFIPFRIICAVAGTVFLTWRAPWAIVLRAAVWRSAWFRWSVYNARAALVGEPLPPRTMSLQPSNASSDTVQSVRFLFTVYENQRWWMGLDWTAALLPGERPSWCSASQHPMSPPNAFFLPDNTTVYLPDGKGGRLKRTAIWKWEEPEWRVVVHKDGGSPSRVERPVPSLKEETPNTSRLIKATAGRLRDSGSTSPPPPEPNRPTGTASDGDHSAEDRHDGDDEELLTDADGWVYGDNKWEAQSNKGGMGKYTRHRRWTRIAVVFEEVESVPPGQIGIHREESTPRPVEEQSVEQSERSGSPGQDVKPMGSPLPESPLRQRLRMALNK